MVTFRKKGKKCTSLVTTSGTELWICSINSRIIYVEPFQQRPNTYILSYKLALFMDLDSNILTPRGGISTERP